MIDLIVIGAVLHFCILGYKLAQDYKRFVDAYEDHIYTTETEDDNDY